MPSFPTRLRPDPRFRVEADGSQTDLVALDPDARKFLASAPVVTPTGDVSLRSFCVDMDQLNENACAGNSTAESVEILNNIAGYKAVPLSRQFIYNLARNENSDLANDNGTYIRSCFDVLSRYGVSDEYLFPYDPTKFNVMPPLMAMRQAMGHKIQAAYRIPDTGNPQDRIDACIAALRAQHPIVFGTQVSSDFENLLGTATQKPPTTSVGGHAMVIVGWIGGLFLVKNSWGIDWGEGGYAYFDPSYISWALTSDLWVPTLGINFGAF